MKNLSLYFFLLLLLTSLIVSGQREGIIYPQDFATKFQDVHVDDTGLGYAVGTCGIIARTSDGQTFTLMDEGAGEREFYAVTCPNNDCQTVVASGEGFITQRVGNGPWRTIDVGLLNISMLYDLGNDVILGGSNGKTYYRSTDAGLNWATVTHTEFLNTPWVFVDGTTGFFVDGTGMLQKTSDAGATFTAVGAPGNNVIRLAFHDDKNGWAHLGTSGLLQTTDGGVTWTNLNVTDHPRRFIFFEALSATHLVGVGIVNEIWESTDAGATWARSFIDGGEGTRPTFNNYHRRGSEWWVPSFNGEIFYFPDGLTGEQRNIFLSDRERLDVVTFLNEDFGFAAGPRGLLLKTTDGGDNWTEFNTMPSNVNAPVYNLDLRSETELILYYGNIRPRISRDGGQTFTDYIPQSVNLQDGDQHYTDANGRLYVMGDANYAFTTNDGGSWTSGTHGLNAQINGMSFPTDLVGYACGRRMMAKTTDGGLTWTQLARPQETVTWNDVHFFDADNGVFTASSIGAYYTTNGGQSWIQAQGQTARSLNELAYDAERDLLYATSFGDNQTGLVEVSQDQGRTWSLIYTSCATNVAFGLTPSGEDLYLLGGGLISRIQPATLTSIRPRNRVAAESLQVFPNPPFGSLTVALPLSQSPTTLSVFSADGRRVQTDVVAPGTERHPVVLTGQPAGIYLLRWVNSTGVSHVGRIVLRK